MTRDNLKDIYVVLLSGEEFQRSERLREILDSEVDAATRDFNLDIFTPENFKLGTFSELIVTFPMMAERRVIVVRNFDSLHPETRKKAAETIKKTPDTTLVIIEGEDAKLTPKPPAKHFQSETFKTIYENRLPSWIQERYTRRGKKVQPKAIGLLINNVGISLRDLDSEIEKTVTAAGDSGTITIEDVARVVGEFRRDTVWNLCNAVGLGDFDSAAGILTRLADSEKNRETYYISSIASHVMKIAEYNRQRKSGVPHTEALKAVTSSPFLWNINKYDDQARNFSENRVRRALTVLTRAESSLKKYGIDKRLMMEIVIPFLMKPKRAGGA